MLTVDEITTLDELTAFEPEWATFLERIGLSFPFLAPEWFACGVAAYGEGKDLLILVVRDPSGIAGIAPLWRYRDDCHGVSVATIGFITLPDTPFVDFVVSPGKECEVLGTVFRHLWGERRRAWDILSFDQWAVDSPTFGAAAEILRAQRQPFSVDRSSLTPYIPIAGDWETFLHSRPARFRKTRRNISNRIAKLENVEIQCQRHDAMGSILKDVLCISERSWKHGAGIAISSRDDTRRFFEVITAEASHRGWLLVWVLKTDGVPIAMEYDLATDGRVYALRADFDQAYEDFSPGTYLEYQIVRSLFEGGFREYSTGPGLNAYKLHWTDHLRENAILRVYNGTVSGRLLRSWRTLRLYGKRFKHLGTGRTRGRHDSP